MHIDLVSPHTDEPGDHVGIRTMTTGEVVLSVSRHEPIDQRITGQFIQFIDGEKVHLRPWAVRYMTPSQLDALATDNGLALSRRTADGHGTPHTEDARRHVSKYVHGFNE